MRSVAGILCLTASLGLAACRPSPYAVSDISLNRSGWDSVRVNVSFSRVNLFGRTTPVDQPALTLHLFDHNFDTLYSGAELALPVPDASLASEEPLLVEVCGRFSRIQVCEQKGFLASPKRISARHEIDYPENGDVEQGAYSVHLTVERPVWEQEVWEEIDSREVTGYWLAYVDGHEDEGVRIPVRRSRGRFNLARLDNYRDFNYYLRSALMEQNEARVRFDLYAGLGAGEARVANDEKIIRKKAREIRELEAGYFVEQAAGEILRRLTSFLGPSRTYVYLDSWQFIESERRYHIEMEITWGSTFFRQRWYRLSGILEVGEDGSEALFRRRRSNDRGSDRWRDRVDGDVLRLRSLQPRPEGDQSFAFDD